MLRKLKEFIEKCLSASGALYIQRLQCKGLY